ncbi:hypothetical protein PENTCL1PPCAC_19344, partial [Pristionchus entomophagus]
LSPFESLPREMIWKIIDHTPESTLNLRLTSRTLKLRADEYAVLKPAGELLCELRIMGPSERMTPVNLSSRISLILTVPLVKSIEFERRLMGGTSFKLAEEVEMKIRIGMKVYRMCFYVSGDCELLAFLGTCMGKRIEKVHLSKCTDAESWQCVANILKEKQIGRLKVSSTFLSDDFSKILMSAINVGKLTLEVKKVVSTDPVSILLQLSSIVRFLHVKQLAIDGIDSNSRYFLGVYDRDWAPVIIETFSGILERLYIDNYSFPEYLSRSSADALRERLPNIDKKIWFEASCDQYEDGLKYTENGYSIYADCSTEVDRFLMIKPSKK